MTQELIHTIFSRRSIRSYSAEPVSEEHIETLLQTAMAAPSASNLKPWHFVVVTDRTTLDRLAEFHPYAKMLYEAPLCIAVCGDPAISASYWVQDCSAATENILLEITDQGYGGVWIGVYPREDRVREIGRILNIPHKIVPFSLIAVGHPAEEKPAKNEFNKERIRYNKWEQGN